jgi:uncharacterized protein HemX
MIDFASTDLRANGIIRFGGQPIVLAAAALVVLLTGVASMAAWRAYTGVSPETDRAVAARQLQARTAQVSEQLVEKAKGLEATQQESIDQLQMVQDQLQTMKRVLAAQQAEAKRLSEQVSGLTEAIDGLRQSFASVQASSEPLTPSVRRNKSGRRHGIRTAQRRGRTGG